jgi:hypothetical protein
MAIQYVITEAEMNSLMDQLKLENMLDKNLMIGGHSPEDRKSRYDSLTPEEQNRLNGVHRAFHYVCVRWAQEMGFKGGRLMS